MPVSYHVGTFGQFTLWNLEKAVKGQRRLPPDVQRIASAETLNNLRSSPGPKWRYIKNTRGKCYNGPSSSTFTKSDGRIALMSEEKRI